MLTPRFTLKQDDEFVYIEIHAPYSNLKDNECLIEDYDFIFFASPYFLRIRLPGKLKDSDKCKGDFDSNNQTYSLKIEKENHGEFFKNLDMVTNFLIPCEPKKSQFDTSIEVVSSTVEDENDKNENVPLVENISSGYGFGNKHTSSFQAFDDFLEVFECRPDSIDFKDRRNEKIELENSHFSSDHYLADLYDLEYIEEHLNYIGPWKKHDELKYVHELTHQEIDLLKELPNKEYILNSNERKSILIGIIDIIYPLMYEYRTTANDLNPESSWTVNKLSATLSWFETFDSVEDCIISLFRRSLIYPLYRNFDLSLAVLNDLKIILRLGKPYLVKLFTEIHSLFNLSQASRYILNDLYIKDYLIFIQKLDADDIKWLSEELENLNITKDKLSLELIELEEAAEIVKNDNAKDYEELAELMKKCGNLKVPDTDSDDSDTSDESEDSSSSDDETDSSSDESDDAGDDCKCQLYVNTQAI